MRLMRNVALVSNAKVTENSNVREVSGKVFLLFSYSLMNTHIGSGHATINKSHGKDFSVHFPKRHISLFLRTVIITSICETLVVGLYGSCTTES